MYAVFVLQNNQFFKQSSLNGLTGKQQDVSRKRESENTKYRISTQIIARSWRIILLRAQYIKNPTW